MSYLVLARKYRPQTFADLVGQEHVTRTLTNAIKLGRIAHGYLFTGTRGVGKTTVARIFAKSLNCESAKGPTPEPCGTCRACKEIAASNSPDVFEIDAASNTSVDDVRELRENVKYLPSRGRYKVYIIDEVHMLSRSAFNALLKTLEEPPPHVVFVFATTEPHRIPDTVLSRTQQYEFKMIGLGEIAAYLKRLMASEQIAVADDVLLLVARKAAGSVRDGLSYMDQVLSYGPDRPLTEIAEVLGVVDRQALLDISTAVLKADPTAALDVLERLNASNWDVKDLLADLLEHFRNLVVVKLARQPERLIDAGSAELAALAEQVKRVESETLEHLFNLLADAEEMILRSGQPRLALEMTVVRMAQGAKVTSLDRLVDQLIEWKSGAPTGGAVPPRPSFSSGRAPSASPAPEAAPVDPLADPRGAFVHALKQKRPSLAAALGGNAVTLENGELIVALPAGFARKAFEGEEQLVAQIVKELFGVGVKLAYDDKAPAAASGASMQDQWKARKEAQERQRAAERETLAHPAVQWTLEAFPGAEVKVDAGEPTNKK
jgi:DNA polymerase-3 subunit gamma/tau